MTRYLWLGLLVASCKSEDKPREAPPPRPPATSPLRRLEGPLEAGVLAWLRTGNPDGLAPIVAGPLPPALDARDLPLASVELATVEASVYWFAKSGPTVRTDHRWLLLADGIATIGFAATTPGDREHLERRANDSTDLRDVAEGFQAIPRAIQLAVRDGKTACITPAFPTDPSVVPPALRPLLADDLGKPLADVKSREIRIGGTCETLRTRQPFTSKHVVPGTVHLLAKDSAGTVIAIITGELVQLRERGMPLQLTLTSVQRL